MNKRWIIKNNEKQTSVEKLSEELNIDPILAKLLSQRGIEDYDQAKSFFRPQLDDLHDPFLMQDMNRAIDRIERAIQGNEKILIYGDYDVDGTTSVALVYSFFIKHYSNLGFYIPDRYSEGYGISFKGVDFARNNDFSLVIALDCGVKANDKIDYARKQGIDFIICDHHYPGAKLPDAEAVLDPKRKDCNYPFKELSGCGVGFKLIHAYSKTNAIEFEKLVEYLDLVAVSIASDIVPIVGENRILAHYGLKQLNNNPRPGLKSIIKIAQLTRVDIKVEDIVFKIGPRINAAGRMESAERVVELLISEKVRESDEIAKKVNFCNDERKNVDRNITQDALRMLSHEDDFADKKSTVLFNDKWHKGVVGIVASRLIEIYYRPTIILTASNGLATGSARSVVGFDIYQAVEACSDLLENFGGHMYAAGLTLKIEKIKEFTKRFEEYVAENIRDEQLIPQVEVDTVLELDHINQKFYNILRQFQPFGPGNMAPVFLTKNVYDNGTGKLVGNSKEHIKLSIIDEKNPMKVFPAIAFQQAQHYQHIHKGKSFNICYSIEENTFRGQSNLQLNIKDIRASLENSKDSKSQD